MIPHSSFGAVGLTLQKPRGAAGRGIRDRCHGASARPGGFSPPSMISSPELLMGGSDDEFRQVVYLFVKVLGRLMTCRQAFGEAINLRREALLGLREQPLSSTL